MLTGCALNGGNYGYAARIIFRVTKKSVALCYTIKNSHAGCKGMDDC